ncbi:LysR family transcriptional regulator [Parashewanella curva]|uniref:LysR family transcriptional regulator n=1 Tax=Parashewanella curva TaxID=2338552 RepID=A0A3L8Q2D2_9GAMM|nr:LysR family transcriptional regulator [Parashewanella curva]RLV60943.1 LysR family transcriptional regulator [Parashewanella curva]
MLENINVLDIKAFLLIAEEGSFTQAAERMQVSRSHVSRRLASLEAQMGVALIERTTRRQRLTHIGQQFYASCKQAFGSIDQAVQQAVDDTHQLRGSLHVNSVGGLIGEELVAELVTRFLSQHKDIDVELDFSSHRIDLIKDQFDVAFRMGELNDAGFVGRKIGDIEVNIFASPEYLKQYGKPSHPQALQQHTCLSGSISQWRFESADPTQSSAEVNVEGRLRCKSGRALLQAAIQHQGIVRLPTLYCQQALENGVLLPVFDDWHIASVPLHLIYHKSRYQPQRLRTFIEFVVNEFKSNES